MIAFATAVLAALGTERLLARGVSIPLCDLVDRRRSGDRAARRRSAASRNLAKVIAASWAGDQADDFIAEQQRRCRHRCAGGRFSSSAWRALLVWLLDRRDSDRRQRRHARWRRRRARSLQRREAVLALLAARLEALRQRPGARLRARQPEPGRVLERAAQPDRLGVDPMLHYDGPMVHGIRHRRRATMATRSVAFRRLAARRRHPVRPRILCSPSFWRHENVRYLYTNVDSAAVHQFFVPTLGVAGPRKSWARCRTRPATGLSVPACRATIPPPGSRRPS